MPGPPTALPVRDAALAVAGAGACATAALVADSLHGALITLAILGPVGLGTVLAAHLLVRRRGRLGGLRRQTALLSGLAALQAVVALGLFVALMYVSGHDALLTVLLVLYAGGLGAWAARLLAARQLADLERVRLAVASVGAGSRDARTGVTGSDELATLARGVDDMVERLAAGERSRGTLIAGLSHDLRTPITSLRLIADAISDGVLDADEVRRYAARMTTHVDALQRLIEGLFELARLEAGFDDAPRGDLQLELLVRQAVEALTPAAEAAGVSLATPPELPPARVRADAGQVQRVLFNLVGNALEHTPPGGHVTVAVRAAQEHVELVVADTGAGVAAEHRDHVFDPLFRGDPSRTDGGSGLGLAICRAIVTSHGGTIELGTPASGTEVHVRLPASARALTVPEVWGLQDGERPHVRGS